MSTTILDMMSGKGATPLKMEETLKEATQTSTTRKDSDGSESRLDFALEGDDTSDFDALYSILKWIVPMIQLGVWTCLLVLPLYNNDTRLVWLWIVTGAQICTNIVGGTYQILIFFSSYFRRSLSIFTHYHCSLPNPQRVDRYVAREGDVSQVLPDQDGEHCGSKRCHTSTDGCLREFGTSKNGCLR